MEESIKQDRGRTLKYIAGRWWRAFKDFCGRFSSRKISLAGLIIIIILFIIAIAAPFISPYSPFKLVDAVFLPPSLEHPMGTDIIGRDIFSQMIWGTRITLLFAFGAAVVSMMVGILLGAIPGFMGGKVDDIFSRFFEIFIMIPRLFLIILIVAIVGSNIYLAMLVVGLTIWPSNARITRAQVLSVKKRVFVRAAVGMGAGRFRILFRHILPNALNPVLANSTLQLSRAVLFEVSLSFLGLGDPSQMSWGRVLQGSQDYLMTVWWPALFAGVATVIALLAFNLFGEGINVALNPRLRER